MGEKNGEKKVKNREKGPCGRCFTRPVLNNPGRSGFWLVPENICVFLPNQRAADLAVFSCVLTCTGHEVQVFAISSSLRPRSNSFAFGKRFIGYNFGTDYGPESKFGTNKELIILNSFLKVQVSNNCVAKLNINFSGREANQTLGPEQDRSMSDLHKGRTQFLFLKLHQIRKITTQEERTCHVFYYQYGKTFFVNKLIPSWIYYTWFYIQF